MRSNPVAGADGQNLDAAELRFNIYAVLLGTAAISTVGVSIAQDLALLREQALPTALFSLCIALSWYLSFSIFPRARLSISLDMSFLLTALCVLPKPIPLAVALGGGLLGSTLRRSELEARQQRFLPALCLNTGSLVLAALAGQRVAGWLVSHWQFRALGWWTVLSIAALFVAYNLVNLVVMSTAVVLRGERILPYLSHYLKYMPTLEIFTIPLALGLALLYAAAGIWGFIPLSGTILTASGLLKRLNRAQGDLSRANEQLQSRSRELRTIYTIGREISSSLDPQVVFHRISANLKRVLDAPHLFLSFRQSGATETYMEYVARDGVVQPRPPRPLGEGFTNWMVESRKPLLLGDIQVDRDQLPCAPVVLDPSIRSILAAPLSVQHEAIGVLCVQSPRVAAYTVDHLSVLTTIALQAAIAIENARNYQLAIVDQLTHLYLRDFFTRKLSEEQARSRRYGSSFTVLMIDVDWFKEINDGVGHMMGDRYLKQVGEIILETMRAADIPCRWGGDEFCVLLPETDREGARAIAERLRTRVEETVLRIGDQAIRATVSIGIASYPEDSPGNVQGLLDRADRALYAAKQAGRNRVLLASDPLDAPIAATR
jgi:diguanylate cyclase (GGDEF)-like protein